MAMIGTDVGAGATASTSHGSGKVASHGASGSSAGRRSAPGAFDALMTNLAENESHDSSSDAGGISERRAGGDSAHRQAAFAPRHRLHTLTDGSGSSRGGRLASERGARGNSGSPALALGGSEPQTTDAETTISAPRQRDTGSEREELLGPGNLTPETVDGGADYLNVAPPWTEVLNAMVPVVTGERESAANNQGVDTNENDGWAEGQDGAAVLTSRSGQLAGDAQAELSSIPTAAGVGNEAPTLFDASELDSASTAGVRAVSPTEPPSPQIRAMKTDGSVEQPRWLSSPEESAVQPRAANTPNGEAGKARRSVLLELRQALAAMEREPAVSSNDASLEQSASAAATPVGRDASSEDAAAFTGTGRAANARSAGISTFGSVSRVEPDATEQSRSAAEPSGRPPIGDRRPLGTSSATNQASELAQGLGANASIELTGTRRPSVLDSAAAGASAGTSAGTSWSGVPARDTTAVGPLATLQSADRSFIASSAKVHSVAMPNAQAPNPQATSSAIDWTPQPQASTVRMAVTRSREWTQTLQGTVVTTGAATTSGDSAALGDEHPDEANAAIGPEGSAPAVRAVPSLLTTSGVRTLFESSPARVDGRPPALPRAAQKPAAQSADAQAHARGFSETESTQATGAALSIVGSEELSAGPASSDRNAATGSASHATVGDTTKAAGASRSFAPDDFTGALTPTAAEAGAPSKSVRSDTTASVTTEKAPRPSAQNARAIAAFQAAALASTAAFGASREVAALPRSAFDTTLDAHVTGQLVHAVRVQAEQGGGQARITLNPDFLGDVAIDVRTDGNSVIASVHASNAELREWMRTNENVLRQSLADQGLSLDQFVIADDEPENGQRSGERESGQQDDRQEQWRRRNRQTPEHSTFEVVL